MGQDHHIHTKSDPENLEIAKDTYTSFMLWSRNATIFIIIVLALMAVFLVG